MVEMIANSLPTRSKLSDRNSCNDNKLMVFGKGLIFVKALISFGYDSR